VIMSTFFKLNGYVKLTAAWTDLGSLGDVVETASIVPAATLDNGSAAGQANALWQETLAVAAGGQATFDLHALPTTIYGGTGSVNMQAVKVAYVLNTGTVDLLVHMPGLLQSSDTAAAVLVRPGAWVLAMSPVQGWSASDHQITVRNQTASPGALVVALAGVE